VTVALVLGWYGPASAASTIISMRNSSDPQGRVFGGNLYLYTSSDLNQSGSWPMNKTYAYSLTNATADPGQASSWTDHGAVLSETAYAWSTMANHLWAPDAFQGTDGNFYLYVPDAYDSAGDSRIGVSVSSSPVGPFAPPSGFTSSNDYLMGGGAYMSDPNTFTDPNDPNGQRYLVYADGTYSNCGHISIAKLDQLTSTVSSTAKLQWTNQSSIPNAGGCTPAYMEGPELGYFGGAGTDGNGKYFLYFAIKDNTGYTESIGYATADAVMGPYTYQGLIMSGQGGTGWTNQASIVVWQNHYLFFYHNDPKNQTYPNREVFLECVGIQNGTIGSVTRGSYTTLSACPIASTGASSDAGTVGESDSGSDAGSTSTSTSSTSSSSGTSTGTSSTSSTSGSGTSSGSSSTSSGVSSSGGSGGGASSGPVGGSTSGSTTSGTSGGTSANSSESSPSGSSGCSCRAAAGARDRSGMLGIVLGLLALLRRRVSRR
jgi:MYXO-CTERM domain-containing protein